MKNKYAFVIVFMMLSSALFSQDAEKKKVISRLSKLESTYSQIANKIWGFAEVGYKEKQSSQLLQETLKQAGFSIESGVAGIPTSCSMISSRISEKSTWWRW